MTWFRVDDQLHDHRKFRKLGKDRLAATGLWVTCGSWAGANNTDGFVPSEIVRRFDAKLRLAGVLVAAGLWSAEELDGEPGYRFHDWSDHQPTRERIEKSKADHARRQQEYRGRKRAETAGRNADGTFTPSPGPERDASRDASRDAARDPAPGRSSSYGTTAPNPTTAAAPVTRHAEQAVATFMPKGVGRRDRAALARFCDQGAADGASWTAIEKALVDWRNRSDVSPAFLPSLITNHAKAEQGATPGNTGQPRRSAAATTIAGLQALKTGTDGPNLRALPGGDT